MVVLASSAPGAVVGPARVELLTGLVMGTWKVVLLPDTGARVEPSLGVVSGGAVVLLPESTSVIDSWLIWVVVAGVVSVRLPDDLAAVSVNVVATVVFVVTAVV